MLYRFAGAELDCIRRELRVGGQTVPLQPQAFAVLEYLIEHRDRLVPKAELLSELWPGVHVGDASLQRAVSLARGALNDTGTLIRTHAKHGYRFGGEVIAAPPVDLVDGARVELEEHGQLQLADGRALALLVSRGERLAGVA